MQKGHDAAGMRAHEHHEKYNERPAKRPAHALGPLDSGSCCRIALLPANMPELAAARRSL